MNFRTFIFPAASCALLCLALTGCKDDETTASASPTVFSVSSAQLVVGAGATATAEVSGGTPPYAIQTAPDPSVVTADLSGSTLTVTGVSGGFSSLVVSDASNNTIRVGASVTGAITYQLFPLTLGNQYTYGGYAINTTVNGSTILPDPNNVYNAIWTLSMSPIPGTTAIIDVTTLQLATVVDTTRVLIIRQDAGTGAFDFLQTLGPFFRAFNILPLGRMDTTRWVRIADPSVGIGGSWTAFDSTYNDALSNAIRLQIIGDIEAGETIPDSATSPGLHDVVRFRTYRNIFVAGTLVVSNATTSRIWLEKNVGPIQVHIAEDTENIGHFRTMRSKNF